MPLCLNFLCGSVIDFIPSNRHLHFLKSECKILSTVFFLVLEYKWMFSDPLATAAFSKPNQARMMVFFARLYLL